MGDEAQLSGRELARLHWRQGRRDPGYHGDEHAREMRRLKEFNRAETDLLASLFLIGVVVFAASKVLDVVAANPLLQLAIGVALLVGGLYLLYRFARALCRFVRWASEMSGEAWWHLRTAWEALCRVGGAGRRAGRSLRAALVNRRGRSVSRYGFPDVYFDQGAGPAVRGPVRVSLPGDFVMVLRPGEWLDGGQPRRAKQLIVASGKHRNTSTNRTLRYHVVFESLPGGLSASHYAVGIDGHGVMPQRFTDPHTALAAARWYANVLTVHSRVPDGYRYDPVRHGEWYAQ